MCYSADVHLHVEAEVPKGMLQNWAQDTHKAVQKKTGRLSWVAICSDGLIFLVLSLQWIIYP